MQDDDFIRYIFNPTSELQEIWQNYFILHPDKKLIAAEAGSIILGKKDFVQMPESLFNSCKSEILNKIR
jgi:hypothetical protein